MPRFASSSSTSPRAFARAAARAPSSSRRRTLSTVTTARPAAASSPRPDDAAASERLKRTTVRWLDAFIVDMNLCPFAKPAMSTLVIETTRAWEDELRGLVTRETARLMACSTREPATTLCVLGGEDVNASFEVFMEGPVRLAEDLCEELSDGAVTVVPFHPKADWGEGDEAGDFTSKSPWATIHLLRQCDIDRAEESWYRDEGREDIRERNVEYLRALGIEELSRRFAEL